MSKKLWSIPLALVLLVLMVAPTAAAPAATDPNYSITCDAVWGRIYNPSTSARQVIWSIQDTTTGTYHGSGSQFVSKKTWFSTPSWNPPDGFQGNVRVRVYFQSYVYGSVPIDVTEALDCAPQHIPVNLCHATPPDTAAQGYNLIPTDDDGALGHAAQHSADIIPPFTYYGGSFPGQNWTPAGQNIWNHGCQAVYTEEVQVTKNSCDGWEAVKIYKLNGVEYDRDTLSGTWDEPFVRETANAFGQTVQEPAECQRTHQVSWDYDAGCSIWTADYSIDGGAPVTYANGSWAEPFVLEDVDVPAFNFPKNPGELYSVSQVPTQHIDESKECQQTHKVEFKVKNNCDRWAWAILIDGTAVWSDQGNWSDPFVLEDHDYNAVVPMNTGELYDNPGPFTGTIDEPRECQKTHQVEFLTYEDCNLGSWQLIIDGQIVDEDRWPWTNKFALESQDYNVDFEPNQGEIYSQYGPFTGTIYEPKECQVAHETGYWSDDTCEGYAYGYTLDGVEIQTGSGTWQDPYGPEAVSVTVDIPENEDELYPDGGSFTFTIDKDRECIQCKVTALYPQATYLDPNAPETYWQGPFELGPGACSVIHPAGQTPSADRVTVICSLCEEQYTDADGKKGYIYRGEHQFLDGWVYKVECYGYETHYWYEGYNWDKWVKLGMYDDQGNRTCNRIEGCADWIKKEAGIE